MFRCIKIKEGDILYTVPFHHREKKPIPLGICLSEQGAYSFHDEQDPNVQ